MAAAREPRVVGLVPMAGLIAVPALFVWLLPRPGYAAGLRKAPAYAFGVFGPAPVLWVAVAAAH